MKVLISIHAFGYEKCINMFLKPLMLFIVMKKYKIKINNVWSYVIVIEHMLKQPQ